MILLGHAVPTGPQFASCSQLIAGLARDLNTPIEVSKSLRDPLIYLNRGAADSIGTLKAIAKASNATLVRTATGYSILRTTEDRKRIQGERLKSRTAWINNRLEVLSSYRTRNFRDEQSVLDAFERDAKSWEAVSQGTAPVFSPTTASSLLPMSVLLQSMVQRIGPERLAAIPSGEVEVFDSQPKPGYRELTACQDLLTTYRASVARFKEQGTGHLVTKQVSHSGIRDLLYPGLPVSPTLLSRLRLQCQADENKLLFVFEGYDSRGNRIDHSTLTVSAAEALMSSAAMLQIEGSRPGARWLNLSGPSRAAIDFLVRPTGPLPSWVTKPTQEEPLSLFVKEAVVGLVQPPKDRCTAIAMSDSLWQLVRGCISQGKVSLDALEKSIAMWLPYERLDDGKCLIYRPLDPEASEARRANRTTLEKFTQSLLKRRPIDLRTASVFCRQVSDEQGSLGNAWMNISRQLGNWEAGDLLWRTYAMLGAISSTDWQRLQNGAVITAAELNVVPELTKLLSFEPAIRPQADGETRDIFDHAMELYPDGQPGRTPISLKSEKTTVIRAWMDTSEESEFWSTERQSPLSQLPPRSIRLLDGRFKCVTDRLAYENRLAHYRFRRGARRSDRVTLTLPLGHRIVAEALGTPRAEARPFALQDLPESIREQYWQQAVRASLESAQKQVQSRVR